LALAKRNGKGVGVTHMAVSPDGKTMTLNIEDKPRRQTAK